MEIPIKNNTEQSNVNEIKSFKEILYSELKRPKKIYYLLFFFFVLINILNFIFNGFTLIFFAFDIFVLAGISILIGSFSYLNSKELFYKDLAKRLGFEYSAKGSVADVSGLLFDNGTGKKIYSVLSGKRDGYNVRMYDYSYYEANGKNSDRCYNKVFEIEFPFELPHMTLMEIRELNILPDFLREGLVNLSNKKENKYNDEHVDLEGDFNKNFNLLVEKGFQIEAREIFTPDIMQKIIDLGINLDFEACLNKLYIYEQGYKWHFPEGKEIEAFFSAADIIRDIFDDKFHFIKSSVKAMKEILANKQA